MNEDEWTNDLSEQHENSYLYSASEYRVISVMNITTSKINERLSLVSIILSRQSSEMSKIRNVSCARVFGFYDEGKRTKGARVLSSEWLIVRRSWSELP